MSGGFRYTPEAIQRLDEIMRKVGELVSVGMRGDEAYMRVTLEMEMADRDRERARHLDEVLRLGT